MFIRPFKWFYADLFQVRPLPFETDIGGIANETMKGLFPKLEIFPTEGKPFLEGLIEKFRCAIITQTIM
jgi:hypothetical protein